MQWPSYTDPVLDKYRTDRRILQIIEPLIGNNIKQVMSTNTYPQKQIVDLPSRSLIKCTGRSRASQSHGESTRSMSVALMDADYWLKDVRSRKPDEAFRDLIHTYVQLGIAVDVHNESTGGMKILPRSHTKGDLKLEEGISIMNAIRICSLYCSGCVPRHWGLRRN